MPAAHDLQVARWPRYCSLLCLLHSKILCWQPRGVSRSSHPCRTTNTDTLSTCLSVNTLPLLCCRPAPAPKPMPASKPASTSRQPPRPKAVVKGVTIEEEPELSDADLWRQRGNEAFKVDDFVKARRMYTQSIAVEPTAAAFSNRALANLKLDEYQKVRSRHGTCREWQLRRLDLSAVSLHEEWHT